MTKQNIILPCFFLFTNARILLSQEGEYDSLTEYCLLAAFMVILGLVRTNSPGKKYLFLSIIVVQYILYIFSIKSYMNCHKQTNMYKTKFLDSHLLNILSFEALFKFLTKSKVHENIHIILFTHSLLTIFTMHTLFILPRDF